MAITGECYMSCFRGQVGVGDGELSQNRIAPGGPRLIEQCTAACQANPGRALTQRPIVRMHFGTRYYRASVGLAAVFLATEATAETTVNEVVLVDF